MRRLTFLLFILAACGENKIVGIDPITGKPKPDPFLTIRVRNLLDTTTAAGKAHWHVYALLTGPYINQNGIALQGAISLADVRLGHGALCVKAASDSVGQRLISVLAVADTTNGGLTPDATARTLVEAWYGGNQVLPVGWAALFNVPADAWLSAQYLAGHGLVASDPIKWGLDWTGSGAVSFYERTDNEPVCDKY